MAFDFGRILKDWMNLVNLAQILEEQSVDGAQIYQQLLECMSIGTQVDVARVDEV